VAGRFGEAELAGQLIFVGLSQNRLGPAEKEAISRYHAGAVWYTELSAAPLSEVKATSDAAQQLAGSVGLLVAANQEGGQIDQFHGPGFTPVPSALEQGKLAPDELRAQATGWGRELKAAGVNLEVAPVLDTVPPGGDAANQPIGALEREFGHDPATVTAHGIAFLHGMHDAGEAVTAKHFPGLGRVIGNTDFSAGVVDSVTTTDDPYLEPFRAAIASGAELVMVSTATYTKIDSDHLAAFSSVVMQDLLRNRLGFRGVIVADDLGAAVAVANIEPGQRAVDFVAAGGDLVTVKYANLVPRMTQALLDRSASDSTFKARVHSSALRVLDLKQRLGLLAC
jgi:beta-N-acetylhexosaminidase